MHFEIRSDRDIDDFIQLGPKGRELAAFVPPEYEWDQLGYGQSEGQVCINNCEWGIYITNARAITLSLHQGDASLTEALELIEKIREHVFHGGEQVTASVWLVGDDN